MLAGPQKFKLPAGYPIEAIAAELQAFSQLVRIKIRNRPWGKVISTRVSPQKVKHAGMLPVV